MEKLTKEKAEEIDAFLKTLLSAKEGQRIDFSKLTISRKAAFDILFFIKTYEQKTGPILWGDSLMYVTWTSLSSFLNQGGFNKVYLNEKAERRRDNFRFWSIFIITAITLIITTCQVYISCTPNRERNRKAIEEILPPRPLNPGSTNPKN